MDRKSNRIGFGGGCHWCTEAVFQSLNGVQKVEQGYISSTGSNIAFSEAVITYFNPMVVSLKDLIAIHLHTHNSTSNHSMRGKYRSAIYCFSDEEVALAKQLLLDLQPNFEHKIITQALRFNSFKPSEERFTNYYYTDPEKPFCRTYIEPKLNKLQNLFSGTGKIDYPIGNQKEDTELY